MGVEFCPRVTPRDWRRNAVCGFTRWVIAARLSVAKSGSVVIPQRVGPTVKCVTVPGRIASAVRGLAVDNGPPLSADPSLPRRWAGWSVAPGGPGAT